MPDAAGHVQLPWPRIRELVTDTLTIGHKTHAAVGLVEYDVSRPLTLIGGYKEQIPGGVSFTAYIVYCLARTVGEHTMLHAYRKGRKKLVVFDDVDVNTVLEKRKPDGTLIPALYIVRGIVRGANHKSLAELNHELRQATLSDLYNDAGVRRRRRIVRLPRALRALLWWWTLRDPARIKRNCGTVAVSNVGAFAGPRPAWGFGPAFLTTTVFIGTMYDRVCWAGDHAEPRKTLSVTFSVNHDVVDGAPAVRFFETFARLLEGADGLDDDFAAEAVRLSEQSEQSEVRHATVR
jgi:pyruvate/2-oxoglutarate dehydrogenase complex dihydrolipoamide acyltransferase (E2) component